MQNTPSIRSVQHYYCIVPHNPIPIYFSSDTSPHHLKINIESYKHKSGVWKWAIGVHFWDLSLVKSTCKKTGYKERKRAVLQLPGLTTGTFTIHPNATPGKPKFCREVLRETTEHSGTSGDSWHPGAEEKYIKEEESPQKEAKIPPFHLSCRGQMWKYSKENG